MTYGILTAVDTETFLIGPGDVAPGIICASVAWQDAHTGDMLCELRGNHPDDGLEDLLRKLLADETRTLIFHNGAYDLTVIARSYPKLIPLIFAALTAGRVTDTKIREKLLNLSMTGRLEAIALPDGSSKQLAYDLASLEVDYGGADRHDQKEGDDVWRMAYSVLDGWRASEYPDDAADYAKDDAVGTLRVFLGQEQRKREWKMASTETEFFQTAADFALRLMTCWGMAVNPEAVAVMRARSQEILDANQDLLIQHGILRPAVPPAPYANQVKKAAALIDAEYGEGMSERGSWDDWRDFLLANGIKFTAGKAPSVNEAALQEYAGALFKRLGRIPPETDGGASGVKQIKLDAEVQEELAELDPVMAQFHRRKAIQKITSNQLPVLESGPIVHFNYDVLKETGRTSSYGNPKGRPALYPATNGQQVPKEIEGMDPRQCYRPREGTAFFDVDVEALELACVGQTAHDLFGQSVHLEKYNAGYNLHSFLASQLPFRFDTHPVSKEFVEACRSEGILGNDDAVYRAFLECKSHTEEQVRAFFKATRDLAKPIGLGFPGGLGAAKMVEFARKQYGVILTEEAAYELRAAHRDIYPEMQLLFNWIDGQADEYNVDEFGETLYWYTTPLGMVRRGATFCAAANGKFMQSPGAEGVKAAAIEVARACYEEGHNPILYGARPIAFVHDQIIGETTTDQDTWHEQCMEVSRIIIEYVGVALPKVKARTEPLLTSVWSKSAVPTFDPNKRLIPWRPEK